MDNNYEEVKLIFEEMNKLTKDECLASLSDFERKIVNIFNSFISDENKGKDIREIKEFALFVNLLYSLIKLKKYNGEDITDLLNSILESKYFEENIRSLIFNDIELLENSETTDTDNLRMLIKCVMDGSGIYNLVNDEVISCIVKCLTSEIRNNNIITEINLTHEKIENNNSLLNEKEKKLKEYKKFYNFEKRRIRSNKKNLHKKIVSLLLSLSFSISLGAGTGVLLDKYNEVESEVFIEEQYNELRDALGLLLGTLISLLSLFTPKVGSIEIMNKIKELMEKIKNNKDSLNYLNRELTQIRAQIVDLNIDDAVLSDKMISLINEMLAMANYAFLNIEQKDIIEEQKKLFLIKKENI